MNKVLALQNKKHKLAIGLMSGTSLDGIDAALVKISNNGIDTKVESVHFISCPYPEGLKKRVLECSVPGGGSVDEVCRLNFLLGEIFADAALELIKAAKVDSTQVDFIGSHGQTIHHLPESENLFGHEVISTLQIGEPAVIARRTGIMTVADFRTADMAAGGQGAPLVPYFDFLVFRSAEKGRVLLNIGGISNFTLLPASCGIADIIAFDTGPGNMIIDALMKTLYGCDFDKGGAVAISGQPSEALLADMLGHPFFKLAPPKSTGREMFGKAFTAEFLEKARKARLSNQDIIATVSEFTVRTIWESLEKSGSQNIKWDEIIVSGGGAKNKYLMSRLREVSGEAEVKASDDLGISYDAKEAMCFAVLANETIHDNPGNVPAATGASSSIILGKISL